MDRRTGAERPRAARAVCDLAVLVYAQIAKERYRVSSGDPGNVYLYTIFRDSCQDLLCTFLGESEPRGVWGSHRIAWQGRGSGFRVLDAGTDAMGWGERSEPHQTNGPA